MNNYQKLLIGITISAVPFALSANVGTDIQTQANLETLSQLEENIKTSFIVTFKPIETGGLSLIKMKDVAKTSEAKESTSVPFGQSGFMSEFKQEIAQAMNLQGEVLSVFKNINAIHVRMSAEEAELLRRDKRVLSVEQDSIITTAAIQHNPVEENPVFDGEILDIPAINSLTQQGAYQDVKLKQTEQGLWKLLEYKERYLLGSQLQNVEIITTDTFPVQVYLKISGEFSTGCGSVGRVNHQLIDNVFNVSVYSKWLNESAIDGEGNIINVDEDEFMFCTQAFEDFEKTIPLSVYSLPAGEYTYNVNDRFMGTFSLEQDNVLP